MGVFGTSNGTVLGAVQAQSDQQFKNVNNLLSLQDNHVEEFFQYHGQMFLTQMEKLMEDVTERVVSQMLAKLQFIQDDTTKTIRVHPDSLRDYEKITQENIELDIINLLNSANDSEVINQRKMAKIGEDTNVTLDLKTIGIIVTGAVAIATTYITLSASVSSNTESIESLEGNTVNPIEFQYKDELVRSTIKRIEEKQETMKREKLIKICLKKINCP